MSSATVRDRRLSSVREALERAGADWLVLPASGDFRWLSGATARVTERMVALAVPREGPAVLVAPRLEADPLAEACPDIEMLVWDEHEDPLDRLAARTDWSSASVVLVGEGLRVPQVLRLASMARCRAAAEVIAPLRAIKDDTELALLARAAEHADLVIEEAADWARPGMSERELARFVIERFEALGDSDPWVIVASGPNSASPHYTTGDRVIQADEVLLLDLGASTEGYASDITRTVFLGEPPRHVLRVHEVVDEARIAGIRAARPGTAAEDVDAAAREVIGRAGLGEHFTHRTGHGVGLEVHEPPFLVKGSRAPLAPGHVHSVEPGVYLPGRFGIRIEDIVAVEAGGARRLNRAPVDLRPLRMRA